MACKDKQKVWVDVKRHERRVLKCQNKPKKRTKAIPNKLKVKLPGIEKKRARPPRQATPLIVGEPSPQNFEEVVLFSNSFLVFFSLK